MKTRTYEKKSVRTTVLIDSKCWDFIQEKGFKPTNLLRGKINELMEKDKLPYEELEEANKRIIAHRDGAIDFIRKNKLLDKYLKNAPKIEA